MLRPYFVHDDYITGLMPPGPAFLFDLDGTLVDSVYQHVLAWREALESVGIELSVWRIHRRIGMSGGLFVHALFRETGRELKPEQAARSGARMPKPTPARCHRCVHSREHASCWPT